jgi:predicted GNAT superfamily acetyltransferase
VTTEVDIRLLDTGAELRRLGDVFDQIWGARTAVVNDELLCAIASAGGYVAAAYLDEEIVGGSLGFLARHRDEPALHSHVTGVMPGLRGTGLGRAIKLHQRAWAADRGLRWIRWTFDPLVRRNARFNLEVLGALVEAYVVDFYGPIDDAVNAADETDRLLVAWPVTEEAASAPAGADPSEQPQETFTVPTPDDIVTLRRTDPAAATAWRRRVRLELGAPLETGARVVGLSRDGAYVVVPGGAA